MFAGSLRDHIQVNETELVSVDDWHYLVSMQHVYAEYTQDMPE